MTRKTDIIICFLTSINEPVTSNWVYTQLIADLQNEYNVYTIKLNKYSTDELLKNSHDISSEIIHSIKKFKFVNRNILFFTMLFDKYLNDDLFQFIPKKTVTETSVFKSLDVKELGGSLTLFNDQIVCTNNYSINAVLNGKKLKISDTYRSNKSIQSKLNPSLLFSSNSAYGLLLHQFNGKVWKQIKIIGGDQYRGSDVSELEPGKILISTRKGIVMFKYDVSGQGTFTPIDQDKSFAKTKQLKGLFYLNNDVLASCDSSNKVFIVDTKAQKLRYSGFSLDEMVSGELWNYTYNKDAGYGWLVCKKGLFKTYFDLKKGFTYEKYPFYKVDLDELSYRVLPEGSGDNEVIWFGSQESKLYRYLPALALKEPAQQFKALIRSISSNGEPVPIVPETLPFSQNNLVFEVAYPLYGTESKTAFSYWLENQDDAWSEYTKDFKKEYTNLDEGTYTFHVRAMDASGHVSDETSVKFKISPPWYRTILAYLIYLGLLVYLFILFGKYQAKKSRGKAEDERRMAELEAAKDLQNRMLPKTLPKVDGLEIASYLQTSSEVGGDYYDFITTSNNTLLSICGDATGHGVASGMMVSVTKASLNTITESKTDLILKKLNQVVKNIFARVCILYFSSTDDHAGFQQIGFIDIRREPFIFNIKFFRFIVINIWL